MNDESAISQLRKTIISQKTAAISDPEIPQLSTAYQLLHDYDEFVTQTVFSVLQGQRPDLTFKEKDRLSAEMLLAEKGPVDNARYVRQFQNYRIKLDEMLSLATQVAAQNQP